MLQTFPDQETKRPRMTSGEAGLHVTRWARHCFALTNADENVD